ncbi:Calpain large subunit, domain-containing protein isoform 1 [Cladophialophora immunda]|nr:Calpain large subunit, domain-containing protein isoform 1 [Cladophialophora immunda]
MDESLSSLEEQARSIERTIPSKSTGKAVLDATIKTAELYFQALHLADKPSDKQRLDARFNELLARAERLKAAQNEQQRPVPTAASRDVLKPPISKRELTTREKIILLEGGRLNGFKFNPWTAPPSSEEFALRDGGLLFTDSSSLPLSPGQLESFDGWKRPQQALPSVHSDPNGQNGAGGAVMYLPEPIDLVQDMTSDCSVVASLCALTSRVERGFPKILRTVVHPFNYETDRMILSPNGKYILRLYFNGCWRRVEIDDYLPSSKTSRVLHVIDRRHPRLLWPALVEKAYLKVRGGYDFPGSNSGTDLAILTGWIPQQVFLHDEEVEPDHLWEEIITQFRRGNVLVTIGTGKLPRQMLVKNPWADGDVWRGAARRRPNRNDEGSSVDTPENEEMMPGTFWMDFNSVFQYFENMYLNWNPGLFSYREDLHFSWDHANAITNANLIVDNPQFAVTISATGDVWLLLQRHFRTGDYTQETTRENGYVGLYLYACDGNKVISSEGAKIRGPLVDSPNTLLRFKATAQSCYTAVLVSQDLPPGKMNFTISALSKDPVALSEARLPYSQKSSLSCAWTRANAGGNSDSANYLSNPQFRMSLSTAQRIALVLRTVESVKPAAAAKADTNVKILVLFSSGSRITRLRPRDVLAHSGDYRRGSAVVETKLGPGNYTIICSTFDQGQCSDFSLDLYYSSSAGEGAIFCQLPAEGAGRLSIKSPPAVFRNGTNRLLAPLTVLRLSRVSFVARYETVTTAQANSSLFKMTLERGQGPYKEILATSEIDNEEFSSVSSGLRIVDIDLQPSLCVPGTSGLWLVLERLAQGGQGGEDDGVARNNDEILRVEMFADERVELGPWGLGDG